MKIAPAFNPKGTSAVTAPAPTTPASTEQQSFSTPASTTVSGTGATATTGAAATSATGSATAPAVAPTNSAATAIASAMTTAAAEDDSVVKSEGTAVAGAGAKAGRWKPPSDIVDGPKEEKKDSDVVKKEGDGAAPATKPAEEAQPVKKEAAAEKVAEKAEEPKKEEPKKEELKKEEPKKEEPKKEEPNKEEPKKEEPKKEELKAEARSSEKPAEQAEKSSSSVDDWEKKADELGKEVEERVAAASKNAAEKPEESATAAVEDDKKVEVIQYDDISYNPEMGKNGKKKYTKDFLMQFKPIFKEKPDDLDPQLEIVDDPDKRHDDHNHSRDGRHDKSPQRGNRRNQQNFNFKAAEQWEKGREGGQGKYQNKRDRYNKHNNNKPQGPPVEPLATSEHGWKREKVDTSTEDGMRVALVKEAQGYLNKMTQVTYEKLSTRLVQIACRETQGDPPLPGVLRELINKVFEQALLQPTFCPMYAKLCQKISRTEKTFRRELLNKCQEEFEADTVEIPAELPENEREMLRFKAKKRMLGNIKFICELYKQKMLVEDIMHSCIQRLLKQDLQDPDEEQTEALCDFLVSIGRLLDRPESKVGYLCFFVFFVLLFIC